MLIEPPKIFTVNIMSANRYDRPEILKRTIEAVTDCPDNCYIYMRWVVPTSQYEKYCQAIGAIISSISNKLPSLNSLYQINHIDGVLPMKAAQMNSVMNIQYDPTITMDDDFVNAKRVVFTHQDGVIKRKAVPITLFEVITELWSTSYNNDFSLTGFASIANPLFAQEKITHTGMLLGQLLCHKPKFLKFDDNLKCLEDLDLVIGNHMYNGGINRINNIIINFAKDTPKKKIEGGYTPYRTKDLQQETLKYIAKKYGNHSALKFDYDAEVGQGVTRKVQWKKLI